MSTSILLRAGLLGAAVSVLPIRLVAAQGAVTGQISILERPGDKTTDLGNTVVYLDPAAGVKPKVSPVNKSMALQSKNFSPHVTVVPAGSKIAFPNQDPFSHNVFSKAPQGGFDTDLYGRGKAKDNVFKTVGVYPLYCNVHPRMTAFVIAVATPYFTQAGADGRFIIDNVPAGRYVLHVWHERGGTDSSVVDVVASGFAVPKIQLDASKWKDLPHKDKNGKDYVNGDVY
ncbi:MAG TPA: hypothetical protein VMH39_08560 [Gemmatimonadaceae bacterium]|nr:hypothetical protein [Gemmatimonadaceae bacterium]